MKKLFLRFSIVACFWFIIREKITIPDDDLAAVFVGLVLGGCAYFLSAIPAGILTGIFTWMATIVLPTPTKAGDRANPAQPKNQAPCG